MTARDVDMLREPNTDAIVGNGHDRRRTSEERKGDEQSEASGEEHGKFQLICGWWGTSI